MTIINRLPPTTADGDPAGGRNVTTGEGAALGDLDHISAELGPAGRALAATGTTDFLLEVVTITEVAFALTATGMLLSVMWLAAPRMIPLAVAGAGLLTGGVLGLVRLPISAASVFLLVLAGASLSMEVLAAPGCLLHAVGGGVALAMGGACLHQPWTGAHPGIVIPASAVVTTGTWLAGRRSWRAVRDDPLAVSDQLIGRLATVLDAEGGSGHAVVAGQVWAIAGVGRPLAAGTRVRVVSVRDGVLIVAPTRIAPP